MSGRARLAAALAGALIAPLPAAAQVPAGEVPGFAVRPPPPFVVTPSSHPGYDVTYSVTSSTGEPRGPGESGRLCQVGFKRVADNARLTQAEINAMAEDGPGRQLARATVSQSLDVLRETVVTVGPARGVEYVTAPKSRPAGDPVRVVFTLVEMPKGRMTASCAVRTAELERVLPVLKTLRDGVTLPQ